MLEIKAGDNRIGIYPSLGGAIAYWLRRDLLIFYPVEDSPLIRKSNQIIAAYPLLPYSNRIADGKFSFNHSTYQLTPNASNGRDSIHGNAWQRAWTLESFTENSVVLTLNYDPDAEFGSEKEWPYAYFARLRYCVYENGLFIEMSCKNTDVCKQPVGMGFHPYLPRRNFVEIGFSAPSVWNNGPDGFPEGRMLNEDQWNFDRMRVLTKDNFLDNCYVDWNRKAFIRWKYNDCFLTVSASPVFRHFVVYTPTDVPFFTMEPATNMNNAINMPVVSDRGLAVLRPNQTLKGKIFYSFIGI